MSRKRRRDNIFSRFPKSAVARLSPPSSACVCFSTRQSHIDTRLFGRLVHVLDHIVVVRFYILSIIMADEELDSFARLNVASEQVNLYFLPRPVPLQSIQVFFSKIFRSGFPQKSLKI